MTSISLRSVSTSALVSLVALLGLGACTPTPIVRRPPPTVRPPAPQVVSVHASHAGASRITFEDIAEYPAPGWRVPRGVEFSPSGNRVTFLQGEGPGAKMALHSLDLTTKKVNVILRADDLVSSDRALSREEELRRERQRKRITGITSYQWAKNLDRLLVPAGGNVYVVDGGKAPRQLTSDSKPDIDPKMCADGSAVALVRNNSLHVVDVTSGKDLVVSAPDKPGVTHGLSDFNAQEEFGEPSGHFWSRDCKTLAFLEVDERDVAEVPVMGYRNGPDLQNFRYPRAGQKNPVVRLAIVDRRGKKRSFIKLALGDGYLGRMVFSHDNQTLYLQHLNRSQKLRSLVAVDVANGTTKTLIQDKSASWNEMVAMYPLKDGSFIWQRWALGHRHLFWVNPQATSFAPLTGGEWDVSEVVGIDDEQTNVWFVGNKNAVLDRQLYKVNIHKTIHKTTLLSGLDGIHIVGRGNPKHGFVDIHSSTKRPPRAEVIGASGQPRMTIPMARDSRIGDKDLRAKEFVTIADQKGPDLHGALLTPTNLKPGHTYPTILMVYGGPGVQTVKNDYSTKLLWQHLADRGFVIFQVDNRGSTGRGHAFESAVHNTLSKYELADQLRGVEFLKTLPYVDAGRIGIYGHSYGGYMAAAAMLKAPGVFKVGVAGSPVTDWRLYDTGYTERYMGKPQDNQAAYDATSLIPFAGKLQGKLFLIHALMDENVHFEHTARLIDALVAVDKDFDLLVFPGERHGYRSPKARQYAYRRVAAYFAEHL